MQRIMPVNINQTQFSQLLEYYLPFSKNKTLKLDLRKALSENGFSDTLDNINFLSLSHPLLVFANTCLKMENLIFNNCVFVNHSDCQPRNTLYFKKCTLIKPLFLDYFLCSLSFKNCLLFVENTFEETDLKYHMQRSSYGTLIINEADPKPIVIAVKDYTFYDKLKKCINKRDISILSLHSKKIIDEFDMPDHPILKRLWLIDGIVLPGGEDIIIHRNHYSHREKLERFLLSLSVKEKIPTLGVCRGHQFIGHYFGATIKDIKAKKHAPRVENLITIDPNTKSSLHKLAKKKHRSLTRKRKHAEIEKTDDGYQYISDCLHHQGLFFDKRPHKRLKITARSSDGIIEGLQFRKHIISFQHHHEYRQKDCFARAALKMYCNMVQDYREEKETALLKFSQL